MKYILLLITVFLLHSCIPLKIAPNLEEGKVLKAKKFVKQLGNRYVYAFEDPKDANEFYNYINAKFQVSYDDFEGNVSVPIDSRTVYLTFYEVSKETQTINLIPLAVDAALENKGHSPLLENARLGRSGTWYIVLTVTDEEMKDCLRPNYKHQEVIVDYLVKIQEEYLVTTHYIEVYLKNK